MLKKFATATAERPRITRITSITRITCITGRHRHANRHIIKLTPEHFQRHCHMNDELVTAYLNARYWAQTDSPFHFKIGERSADLQQLLRSRDAASAAFLTACNPFSMPLDQEANNVRQEALEQQLVWLGSHYIHGWGEDPLGVWEAEASFLIFDLEFTESQRLATVFQQNAWVQIAADGRPELRLHNI